MVSPVPVGGSDTGAFKTQAANAINQLITALAQNSSAMTALPVATTGDGKFKFAGSSYTETGWVRANGLTIGSASSGATERANADTAALFAHIWTQYANAQCPVSGGRGASAAADFAANKTIQLPDIRGRAPFGLDDLGNSAASRITGATASPNGTTAGATGGAQTATLGASQIPVVGVIGTSGSQPLSAAGNGAQAGAGGGGPDASVRITGGGGSFDKTPPFFLGVWLIKL